MSANGFPRAAATALRDTQLRHNLRVATHTIRAKRDHVVAELDDCEQLREAGQRIEAHTMRHLDVHLETLERTVTRAGGMVHWASDAAAANRIVTDLVRRTGAEQVVKVKSLTTDEIHLSDALGAAGIAALETDLAELMTTPPR